jgi:homoserine O-succinyltransferase/O-acetyltransferase
LRFRACAAKGEKCEMPVLMDIGSGDHHLFKECERNRTAVTSDSLKQKSSCIAVGIINNMPDSALVSTERQLFDLLNAASVGIPILLRFYALPTVSRADWGRQYIRRFYAGVHELWGSELDGLIVTGAEPHAPNLAAEQYWGPLTQVIDWARENTISAVWSCLAVHGAVLHLDGIERQPLPEKCSGVFDQAKTRAHPLLRGVRPRLRIPHSRWNEVREDALLAAGYFVLTKSVDAGVDMFVKRQKKSQFVFFQGHPEYDALSLLGEYRRDVGRYLRQELKRYPTMPHGYFDDQATDLLIKFQKVAVASRRKDLLAKFPIDRVAMNLRNTWHLTARRIYRNWIIDLSEQKRRGAKGARSLTTKGIRGLSTG